MSTLQTTQLQNPSDTAPSVVLMPGKKVQVAGELELTDVIKIDSDPNSAFTTTLQQAVPATQNVTLTLPPNGGTAGQALVTNGSGVTSWATVAPDLTVARTLTGAQTFNCPIVFNENGDDLDLRLEGDTTPNLVFLDASTDRIGINQSAPATRLDLNGSYSSNLTATGTTINCSLGNYFTISVSADTTISVSNVPASRVYSFVLRIYHTGGTITWFTSNWPNATAPLLSTPKYHEFIFFTEDGGTTWRASYLTNFAS